MITSYQTVYFKILRLAFKTLLSLITTLLLFAIIMSSTTFGLRLTLHFLANQQAHKIVYTNVQGSILSKVSIDQIVIDDNIQLNGVHMNWRSLAALATTLSVESATITSEQAFKDWPFLHKFINNDFLTVKHVLINPPNLNSDYNTWSINLHYYSQDYKVSITPSGTGFDGEILSSKSELVKFHKDLSNYSIDGSFIMLKSVYQVQAQLDFSKDIPLGDIRISNNDSNIQTCMFISQDNEVAWQTSVKTPSLELVSNGVKNEKIRGQVRASGSYLKAGDIRLKHWRIDSLFDESLDTAFYVRLAAKNIQLPDLQVDDIFIKYQQKNTDFSNPSFLLEIKNKSMFYRNEFFLDQLYTHINHNDNLLTLHFENNRANPFSMDWTAVKQSNNIWKAKPSQLRIGSESKAHVISLLPEMVFQYTNDYLSLSSITKDQPFPLAVNLIYYFGSSIWSEIQLKDLPIDYIPLALLNMFDIYPTGFEGIANGNLVVSKPSSTQQFILDGQMQLNVQRGNLQQILPDLPLASDLKITNSIIQLNFKDNTISLSSDANVNQGKLLLEGSILASLTNPQYNFNLKGKKIVFEQPHDGFITLNTELDISYQDTITDISGQVDIIDASYHNQRWQTALKLPEETTIQQDNLSSATALSHSRYNLKIDFGKKTYIHAYGFHGQLQGDLSLTQKANDQRFLVEGSMYMNDAILLIYGQQLPLAHCRLNWYQSHLNKPHVDMLIKKTSTVSSLDASQEYGIDIHGNIDDLKVNFYASPREMTHAEILTHLLLDKQQYHREYTESIDSLLQELNYHELGGHDLSIILDVLASLKRALFFDRIELSNSTIGDDQSRKQYDEMEVLLTRMLNERFALSLRLNSSDPSKNQFGFDALLSDKLKLRSYFAQNPSTLNFELYYQNNQ